MTAELDALRATVNATLTEHGEALALTSADSISDLLLWIQYFRMVAPNETAIELLFGARAAAGEFVAYSAMGLGRAAISAIRSEIDLLLGYTFFKDHSAEWKRVTRTGDGFMMRSQIEKYHEDAYQGFASRRAIIERSSGLSLQKTYRILSAHIHGQSPLTLPKFGKVSQVVSPDLPFLESVISLQGQAVESLSNYLVALYARNWPELPEAIVQNAARALDPKQRPAFFKPMVVPQRS